MHVLQAKGELKQMDLARLGNTPLKVPRDSTVKHSSIPHRCPLRPPSAKRTNATSERAGMGTKGKDWEVRVKIKRVSVVSCRD